MPIAKIEAKLNGQSSPEPSRRGGLCRASDLCRFALLDANHGRVAAFPTS